MADENDGLWITTFRDDEEKLYLFLCKGLEQAKEAAIQAYNETVPEGSDEELLVYDFEDLRERETTEFFAVDMFPVSIADFLADPNLLILEIYTRD